MTLINEVALSLSQMFGQHTTRDTTGRAVSSSLVHAITRAKGSTVFAESSAGAV